MGQPEPVLVHGSAVAWNGDAVLIRGSSGSGKSALALQLMALGADLVSDDQTLMSCVGQDVVLSAPDTTRGLIEARFVGILRADTVENARLRLVVDLDQTEPNRLPHPRQTRLLGQDVPLLFRVDASYFAAAVLQFLRFGRNA